MGLIVLVAVAAAVALLTLGVFELRGRHQQRWRTVELQFGRDVTPEAVVALLDQVSALPRRNVIALDVMADAAGIRHFLRGAPQAVTSIETGLQALAPSVRAHRRPTIAEHSWSRGSVLRLSGRLRTLRHDDPSVASAGVLAALQPLGESEAILLRWMIRPGRTQQIPVAREGQLIEPEDRRRLRVKNEGSVLFARGLVAVATKHRHRDFLLLTRVVASLRTRNTAYGHIRPLGISGRLLPRLLSSRSLLIGDRYAAAELAGLLGWPMNGPLLPGLELGIAPQLMPSRRLPVSDRVLGTTTWPGNNRAIGQPLSGALSHSLITGPTGVGKSTLLTNLIAGDIAAGRGALLIDGKGDTVRDLLARI